MYSEAKTKRSVRTKSKSWSKFRNKLTDISFDYKVQLKIDITNYYPTIYTHSIPWSILGKDVSKQYFKIKSEDASRFNALLSTDIDAKKYQIADNIDTLVRNCNDKQSIGLPIGPDSSFILSEMLGSRLDKEIAENIHNIDYKCIRYYDDYYFYTNSIGDAETILKIAQQVFYEYKLEINENKVNIKQLPYFQSDLWNIEIHNYQFKNAIIEDLQDLSYYFSLIFKLVDENKETSSWVISYSLTRFEYGKVRINKQNINTFISLLLKTLYLDTSNIDQIFKIILSYKSFLDLKELKKIKTLLDKLIPEHLSLNHSFEVAWGLWFFKSFDIQPNNELLQSILNSEDQIAILITMDIINNKPLNKRNFDFTILKSKLTAENLFSKFWLICYELEIKGWSIGILDNIKEHQFFNILKYFSVDFYNLNSQVKTNFTARNHFITNPFDDLELLYDNLKDTVEENEDEEDGNDEY